ALRRADPLARPGRRQPHGVLVPALSKRRGAAGRVRRSCAPSSNTCRPLARDHTAPEPALALSKAIQPCCGQVRTLAWCSRPRDSAALLEGALMRRALGIGAWLLAVAAGLGVFLVLPHLVSDFHSRDLARAGVFFIAIVGLNLLTGYTGQISLGHGALMAIGGYTTAALVVHEHWRDVWT